MRLRFLLGLLLAGSLAVPAGHQAADPSSQAAADFMAPEPVQPLPAPIAGALAGIGTQALSAHVFYFASPALAGRGLATPGLEAAGGYVAESLAQAGIPSLGPGYFQRVPLRMISDYGGRLTVERRTASGGRVLTLPSGADCVFSQLAPRTVLAPVVFAGYGIREPELGRDDYRGLDVRGAAVLALAGTPDGEPWQRSDLAGRYASSEDGERWAAKLETARSLGAAALLGIERESFAARAEKWAGAPFFLAGDRLPGPEDISLIRVSGAAAEAVLDTAGLNRASAGSAGPRFLPGAAASIRLTGTESLASGGNVIGVIAGSDSRLREEAVVIGAHLDHLGIFRGRFYPGADDNASGAAALLEIAKAFAGLEPRPKRTIVIAFWTGEEEGKFGSGFYVRNPLWPLDRTVAYLNLDMIGHPWLREEIEKLVKDAALPDGRAFLAKVKPEEFIEPGLPPGAEDLEAVLRRAARALGLALHFDRTDGMNGGSDYRDFARAGVPFIRFFGNFFPGYHEPGDTPEALDPVQVQRMARLVLATAWLLADR